VQLALSDCIQKRPQFRFLAADLKLHTAVDQISDPTGNIKSFRDMPHHPAEANALDRPFVENLEGNHLNAQRLALDVQRSNRERDG
jgi:hypothetical protein